MSPPDQMIANSFVDSKRPPGTDGEHLRILAVCHYVFGGLVMAFSLLFIIHIGMGVAMLNGALPFPQPPSGPAFPATGPSPFNPPAFGPALGWLFIVMGSIAITIGWTFGILAIISGRSIAKRRRRVFSLVIAGVSCASFPFGTVLGVFTFIVLLRASVRQLYEATASQPRDDSNV